MEHELAQINVARLLAPIDSPAIQEFKSALQAMNLLAESSDGFVWRLVGNTGDATDIQILDDPLVIVNMSVWRDLESLKHYTYKSGHAVYVKRRKEWFRAFGGVSYALWWVPRGHRPDPAEGLQKLVLLESQSATQAAFSFASPFAPPRLSEPIHRSTHLS